MNSPRTPSCSRGFSLPEMMIAMALGLILLGGLIQIFLQSKESYRLLANLSRVQENGRIALDILARDLRMAGYMPCKIKSGQVANTVNGGDDWNLDFFNAAIRGYEGGVSTFPTDMPVEGTSAGNRVTGSDAVVILGGSGEPYGIDSHNAESAQFSLDRTRDNLEQGDLILACDATTASLFQMTGPVGTTENLVHNTGTVSPGNCTKYLGYPSHSPCTEANTDPNGGTSHTFGTDSTLVKFDSRVYFVGVSESGTSNSLYKQSLLNTAGTIGSNVEELVEDVDSMQILYGEDTDSDDEAERYVTADLVGDWNEVISVRVGVLVRSPDEFRRETDTLTYNVSATKIGSSGTTVTHDTDRRIRQAFTSTVKIRNRGRMGE